jgi:hypothetical protein
LFTLFQHHDNPADMPDKYNTSVYGQGIANLLGYGYGAPGSGFAGPINANGTPFTEDPSLEQITGTGGFVPFIEKYLSQYAGNPSSAPAWLQPMLKNLTGLFGASSTGSGQFHWGHNIGQDWITGAQGVDGQVHSYQDYLTAMNQFIQAYTANLQNASQMTIVALNQFGSAVGFLPANWDTPGYDYPNNPQPGNPLTNQPPGGTTTPPPPGGTTPPPGTIPPPGHTVPPGYGGGGGGTGEGNQAVYTYTPSGGGGYTTSGGEIHTHVNLDGREIALSVQAHNLRTGRQGYQRIS